MIFRIKKKRLRALCDLFVCFFSGSNKNLRVQYHLIIGNKCAELSPLTEKPVNKSLARDISNLQKLAEAKKSLPGLFSRTMTLCLLQFSALSQITFMGRTVKQRPLGLAVSVSAVTHAPPCRRIIAMPWCEK